MWFVTPTAARWGNDGEDNVWVAHHATCIEKARAMKDGIEVALLGDSITQGCLDLWRDFTNIDGMLKTELYSDKHLHLGPDGYEVFATNLKVVVEKLLNVTTTMLYSRRSMI